MYMSASLKSFNILPFKYNGGNSLCLENAFSIALLDLYLSYSAQKTLE